MSSRAYRRLIKETEEAFLDTSLHVETKPCGGLFSKFDLVYDHPLESPLADSSAEDILVPERKSKKRKLKEKRNRTLFVEQSPHVSKKEEEFAVPSSSTLDTNASTSLTSLLTVDTRTFDPASELNRMFRLSGRVAETSYKPQSHVKRGPLVRVKPNWPPIVRFGLDMENSTDGEYTFTHTREYRNTQKDFYIALRSAVPDNITLILSKCPYHIDSLLQLGDIFIHQEDTEIAIDLFERVLHAYQSVFHPSFNPALGSCRLDFTHQENRGLFVALFRYLTTIGARGCYRSALDYCKILFSLSVEEDPLATLLMIDYYALLARQLTFLTRLYDELNPSRSLYLLPNFAFSIALASKWLGSSDHSDRDPNLLLQDALISFPGFLTRLMKHCTIGGVANLNKSTLFGKEVANEPESLGRLLDLYVARAHQLWTTPETLSWLEHNVELVLNLVEPTIHLASSCQSTDPRLNEYSKRRRTLYPSLPLNILRHLVLADFPEAPPLLPNGHPYAHIYTFDPFPPPDSINICSRNEQRGSVRSFQSNRSLLSVFIDSLLPSYSTQQETDDVYPDGSAMPWTSVTGVWSNATQRISAALRRLLGRSDNTDGSDTLAQQEHHE